MQLDELIDAALIWSAPYLQSTKHHSKCRLRLKTKRFYSAGTCYWPVPAMARYMDTLGPSLWERMYCVDANLGMEY